MKNNYYVFNDNARVKNMNEVKTISEVSSGMMFVCLSAKTQDRVEVYNAQKPVDGGISFGKVFRDYDTCEIYNPDFEVQAI